MLHCNSFLVTNSNSYDFEANARAIHSPLSPRATRDVAVDRASLSLLSLLSLLFSFSLFLSLSLSLTHTLTP